MEVNSVRESIVQLKGKTSKLTRTIEETKLELADLEANTYAQIVANTRQILMKVSKDSIISEINQTAENITIKAEKIDLVGLVEADEFVAKYATINELAGVNMTLSGEINAMSGRIDTLESDYISTKELETETANIKGMITAVDAKFEALDASKITAGTVSVDYLDIDGIITGLKSRTLQSDVFMPAKYMGQSIIFIDTPLFIVNDA